jgi:tetratricopeptide (TPR) repeat protein
MKRWITGLALMAFTIVIGGGVAYSQASSGASSSAQEALEKGNAAWHSNKADEAQKWYRIAADQGNAEAQFHLWEILSAEAGMEQFAFARGKKTDEQVVDSKTKEAREWLLKSAEQGYANAQCSLGWEYYSAGDKEKGLVWLRKAAAQGNEDAKTHLRRACTDVCDSTYKTCMNPCNLDSACIDACQRDWKACKEACGGN